MAVTRKFLFLEESSKKNHPTQVFYLSHVNPTRTFPMNIQQIILCLILSLFSYLTLLGQTDSSSTLIAPKIKQLEHTEVKVQNTFRINSKKLEFSPTYYQNGVIYVTLGKEGEKIDGNIGVPFFELFYAELDGEGMPSNPQPFSAKVNSSTHEGPSTFNFTEDIIYYTSNSASKNTQGKKTMKIFEAKKGTDDWEESKALSFNGDEYTTMHPTLTANGQRLYFASNRPGGYGETDIYYVENTGTGWGEPVNLGPTVNTNKREAFPFIHESGRLFFSSEGHGSKGGYDIFAVNTHEKELKELIHLGAPFNTESADFGLILNPTGMQGYFTSARYGGIGQDDIYLFDAPNGLFSTVARTSELANITVVEETDGTVVDNAGIYIFEKNKSGLFGEEDLYEVVLEEKADKQGEMEMRFVMKKELGAPDFYTDETGSVETNLAANQEYLFLVTKKGYANKELRYSTFGQSSPMSLQIPLSTKKCVTISGIVQDEKTGTPIVNATIFIKSNCNGATQFVSTDATGKYGQCIPFGCDYTLGAEKDGFNTRNTTISTKNVTKGKLKKDILLSPNSSELAVSKYNLAKGSIIILENVYYDFNKSAIRAGAAEELDALVTLMQAYPSMEVELMAHTDARGDAAYNRSLSRERAISAKDYLSRNGIAAERIKARGMGEIAIRNHCENGVECDDKEHEYNRRTEVRVTKFTENVGGHYSGKE